MHRLLAIILMAILGGCGSSQPYNQSIKPADTIVLDTEQDVDSSFTGIASHLVDKGYSIDQRNKNIGHLKMEPESFEHGEIILSIHVQGNQDTSVIRVSGQFDDHNVTRQAAISDMISKDKLVEIKRSKMKHSKTRAAWYRMKNDVIDYPHQELFYESN